MSANPKREIQVGIGVVALAAFSIFVVIPSGVTVPESIKVRVMAPDFWPLIVSTIALIAGVLVLIGGVLDLGRGKISTTTHSLDDSVPLDMEGDSYRPFREATVRAPSSWRSSRSISRYLTLASSPVRSSCLYS